MKATIKDVAKKSGYSIATVSLVMNNKNVSIPQETRDKILKVADELDYRPNQLAVSMITKKTNVLGLIIPDNSNLFFADLSKAIEIAARHAGYNLIYGNSNNNSNRDIEYMKMFVDRRVDGIIYAKSNTLDRENDKDCIHFIQRSTTPIVAVDRVVENSSVSSIVLDHFQGGYLAARHLLQLGHRRIGCYTGPHNLNSSQERLSGCKFAFSELDIPFDDSLVYEGTYQIGPEHSALAYFLNKGATAIFAFNDIMAYGIYREARRANLSIPKDLSVVGFDDTFFSEIIQPSLTTIRQPIRQMGKCVVETLLKVIQKGADVEKHSYVFKPELISRESTASPSGKEGYGENIKFGFSEC